jgi:DNA-binding CsgD family transcriptional regulator
LTPREYEALAWAAHGEKNAEIAKVLLLSPATVRTHLENTFKKLGVATRTAAVARVLGNASATGDPPATGQRP